MTSFEMETNPSDSFNEICYETSLWYVHVTYIPLHFERQKQTCEWFSKIFIKRSGFNDMI